MSHRMIFVTVLSFLVCSLPTQAQTSPTYHCAAGPCSNLVTPDRGPIRPNVPSPAVPSNGKWEVLDFKPGSGSVSCGVVKYEVVDLKPTVHLLCPAQEIYAPIRVHLTLTWKSTDEVPSVLRTMYVDLTQVVKFRSAPGQDPSAELTLEEAQKTHPQKQWIHFSKVNVALVLPAEK